jgi:hypothetical protein
VNLHSKVVAVALSARTVSPVVVVTAPIVSMITSWEVRCTSQQRGRGDPQTVIG